MYAFFIFTGGELTSEKRNQLINILLGQEVNENSPSSYTAQHTPLFELQKGVANITPWDAFCHHVKFNMKEEFQLNWLNQTGENATLNDAFEQAKSLKFPMLLTLVQKERLGWLLQAPLLPPSIHGIHGTAKIVKFIILHYESLNIKFNTDVEEWDGNQTFHKACEVGQSELVKVLMKNSAKLKIDLNLYDDKGRTPFLWACKNGRLDVVKIFMDHASTLKIDIKNKGTLLGSTALHMASRNNRLDLVKFLIKNSAILDLDINAKDNYGKTALKWAETSGYVDVTKILIESGANQDTDSTDDE